MSVFLFYIFFRCTSILFISRQEWGKGFWARYVSLSFQYQSSIVSVFADRKSILFSDIPTFTLSFMSK